MVNGEWMKAVLPIHHSPFTIHRFQQVYSAHKSLAARDGERLRRRTLLIDSDLFEPYERLITIEILGRRVGVPENNRLLRCFQYLSMRSISYGDFCWNGECTNCQFWYRDAGQEDDADKTALSCRFKVREGMVITRLSPHVKLEGININNDEVGTMKDE